MHRNYTCLKTLVYCLFHEIVCCSVPIHILLVTSQSFDIDVFDIELTSSQNAAQIYG